MLGLSVSKPMFNSYVRMRLSYSVRANERPLVTFIYKHYGSCFFSCLVVSGSAKDIEREIFPL